jgi:GMP synthase (glutamine-hydrolysing)
LDKNSKNNNNYGASNETVIVLDFGGQYKELIARRAREQNVYAIILPSSTPIERIKEINPIGIIFTGGPDSVYDEGAPFCDPGVFSLGVPILGICYGHHYMCAALGGTVERGFKSEFGSTEILADADSDLFFGLDEKQITLMSHADFARETPPGFKNIAVSKNCENAAIADAARKFYGVQFHPEVERTENGTAILRNFLYRICGASGDYGAKDFIKESIINIRNEIGEDKILLALSGGVDSSVCAALLAEAVPNRLFCVFVDHGLMRKNEGDEIEAAFKDKNLNFIRVDAEKVFLDKLKGVTDPEQKRKIIGAEFIAQFHNEAKKLGAIKYLAQGTIYPDVIESGANNSANIKSHHNVGALPKDLPFKKIIEPLRNLFKDETRKVGVLLGLPESLVNRQPFPGPGLAVRVIGEVTKEKLDILREADFIFRFELEKALKNSELKADQYFAVLTNARSVGVMGDFRSYDYAVALRAISTNDFMTCDFVKIPYEILETVSSRIVNEVKSINRVVYDITGKPPATVEWE